MKAAKNARLEFKRALHLYPPKASEWQPKVNLCSALEETGIQAVWEMISEFKSIVDKNNYFDTNRHDQNKFWLLQTINEHLKNRFYKDPKIKIELNKQLEAIENNETTPFAAAKYLLNLSRN